MTVHRLSLPFAIALASLSTFCILQGCDKGTTPSKPAEHGDDHAHGETVDLGTQTADALEVRAARDGDVKPGSDVPIDAWVTGGTVNALRFWIGTEDAKGSIKAKADREKENWHSHVEVPATLPEGSKLWVEIESDKGERTVVSFDLKLH
jgi:hypothetical protein